MKYKWCGHPGGYPKGRDSWGRCFPQIYILLGIFNDSKRAREGGDGGIGDGGLGESHGCAA